MLLETAVEAELAAEAEHVLLELASLLNAEVSVTEIILQALQARVVGLKKVVGLGRPSASALSPPVFRSRGRTRSSSP